MKYKRFVQFIMLMTVIAALFSGCCKPPKVASVGMNLHPQERDWWCWAAAAEMISQYYGHTIEQCDSASYVYNKDHNPDIACCTGCTGNCPCWGSSWGVYMSELLDNWDHWNFTYTHVASSLSWTELKKTISTTSYCRKSPIEAIIPGHVVVVYGYAEIDGNNYVFYRDPWEPNCDKDGTNCTPKSGGNDVVTTYAAFTGIWNESLYSFKYTGP